MQKSTALLWIAVLVAVIAPFGQSQEELGCFHQFSRTQFPYWLVLHHIACVIEQC